MTKVLLVDDNRDILEVTAALLRRRGYEVVAVATADEILPAVKRESPDILLQDCHMPGLDLAPIIKEIRALPGKASMPILLFTASIEAQEFWRAIGADGLVRKPFEADELRQSIDRLIVPKPAGP